MSTRSVILITGHESLWNTNPSTRRLYKHSDGYPSGNLPLIASALRLALKQCEVENRRNNNLFPKDPKDRYSPSVEQVTGHLIGESTSVFGMGAWPEHKTSEALTVNDIGTQWDVEYIYVIDLEKRTVSVYSGNFDSIQKGYLAGTINPMSEDEGRDKPNPALARAVKAIRALNFTIAPPGIKPVRPKRYRAPKQSHGKVDLIISGKGVTKGENV